MGMEKALPPDDEDLIGQVLPCLLGQISEDKPPLPWPAAGRTLHQVHDAPPLTRAVLPATRPSPSSLPRVHH
jgi:hypothetical protein